MAMPLIHNMVRFLPVLLLLAIVAEATPPGIANHPSHARCLIKKYKYCYNLEHVCPKFCPDDCHVECVSCKPICGPGAPAPPEEGGSPPTTNPPDNGNGGEGKSPPANGNGGEGKSPPSNDNGGDGKSPPGNGNGGDGKSPPGNGNDGEGKSPPGNGNGGEGKSPPPSPPQSPPPSPPQSPPPSPPQSPPPSPPKSPPPSPPQSPPPSPPQSPPPSPPTVTPSPPPPTSPPQVFSPPPTPVTPSSPPPPTPTPPPYLQHSPPPTVTPSPTPSTPAPPTPTPPQFSPPPLETPPSSSPPSEFSPPPTPLTPSSPPPTQTPPTVTPSPPPSTPTSPPAQTPPQLSPPPLKTPPSSPPPPENSPPPTPVTPSSPPTPTLSPPTTPPSSPPSTPTSPLPPYHTSKPPNYYDSPPGDDENEAGVRRKRCKNKDYPQCYGLEHVCPSDCPHTCEVDCVTCKPVCKCDMPGAVCQDPRFIGGDGITFYFHGKKNKNFCLVTEPNLHINAHFIGRRNENMKRDFTWVQSIGILFGDHQLFIGAQKTAAWDDSVARFSLAFDGQPISLGAGEGADWRSATVPSATVKRDGDANSAVIEVDGLFRISAKVVPITQHESKVHNYGITEDDCFAHLELGFKFFSLSGKVNGVLGQTYRDDYVSKVKMGVPMPVLGGEREFSVSSLFAPDCAASQFKSRRENGVSGVGLELPSMKCGSGIDGRGVVCKR